MSAIISALDNHTSKQFGENGHVEYGWSNSLREQILQFSFQVIRTKEDSVNKLKAILRNLLISLKNQVTNSLVYNNSEREVAKGLLSVLYRLIGQTRDIIDGKGEYTLTYMMIHTWYEFYPELAFLLLNAWLTLATRLFINMGHGKISNIFVNIAGLMVLMLHILLFNTLLG